MAVSPITLLSVSFLTWYPLRPMTVSEFIGKWRKVDLKERSAAQEHFLDLCSVFDHPTPAAADPTGETFCFEKGAAKHGGGDGFADVWKRGFFGWEYKGKRKDLEAAYDQLLRYRDALESPPLLVLCDLDRIIIRTNFTGTVSATYEIPLEALAEPRNIEIVRAVFHNPEAIRPGRTSVAVTQEAARVFGEIAAAMRTRGLDPAAVAHFLDRLVFCLFAEDVGLLPAMIFTRISGTSSGDTVRFAKLLGQLFDTMATGGDFGLEPIRHFNGNLFDDRTVLDLTPDDVKRIAAAASLDWSAVDPSIFGTLFERGLDPAKRSQLGAHFTGREDIELVVDAVVMAPLRREWEETKVVIENLLATGKKGGTGVPPVIHGSVGVPPASSGKPLTPAQLRKARGEADSILHQFLTRLREIKIFDPACGSGNFLYVALLRLKDLEREAAVTFTGKHGLNAYLPGVGPWQLYGIEVNAYAHDLAQMTVWIGWLQWIRANGFGFPADPILRPLSGNIRLMDAVLGNRESGIGNRHDAQQVDTGAQGQGLTPIPDSRLPIPGEPEWPTVDFIIGNPPFLGDKIMRRELGDAYVDRLRTLYADRIPGQSDLCCYWFEKARAHIAAGKCKRAGLLATQNIRGLANREVLKRILASGGIFFAESDRPWVLNGANVHISMVGFDDGTETAIQLDGKPVERITPSLSSASDVVTALHLPQNVDKAFIGSCKGGPFDIPEAEALRFLTGDGNPHGRPNSDVVRPVINTEDLFKSRIQRWIIDNADLTLEEATLYEAPHAHVVACVKPQRDSNRDPWLNKNWWRPQRMRSEMRSRIAPLPRFLVTATTAKHQVFVWLTHPTLPDHKLTVFAFDSDSAMGVLQSRIHQVWSLRLGTRLETRPNYTPSTCFETFPFPDAHAEHEAAIAAAATELNEYRARWLNPPEWTRTETLEFPGTVGGPWDRYIDPATAEDRGAFKVGTVRYSRLVPRDVDYAVRLKDRTLTKLYNTRPAWLADCHARLDAAVAAAYGWPADLTDDAILERLLALNLAQSHSEGHSDEAMAIK
jgi:hypothetical protein